MRDEIEGRYSNPEKALERLENLTQAEQEALKNDPTVIGKLASGVEARDVNTERLSQGAHSFEITDKFTKKSVDNYDRQVENHARSLNEGKGLESQMNQSLSAAPTLTHHLSI